MKTELKPRLRSAIQTIEATVTALMNEGIIKKETKKAIEVQCKLIRIHTKGLCEPEEEEVEKTTSSLEKKLFSKKDK